MLSYKSPFLAGARPTSGKGLFQILKASTDTGSLVREHTEQRFHNVSFFCIILTSSSGTYCVSQQTGEETEALVKQIACACMKVGYLSSGLVNLTPKPVFYYIKLLLLIIQRLLKDREREVLVERSYIS